MATIVTAVPATTSFAEKSVSCHFGDQSTSLDDIFKKDLVIKAFTEKHPNATRHVTTDETNPSDGELTFATDNKNKKETLMVKFTQNENGCYRPKSYHYSYDDGIINFSITNYLSNFTEIINLIKSDEKKIEDIYSKNCNPINLDYVIKGESNPYFCKIDESSSIIVSLQNHAGGPIEIGIPDKVMDALFYNCIKGDDYFVLVNEEEVDFEWSDDDDIDKIIVNLPTGYSKVEIIWTFQMNLSQEGFCGSIWSQDGRYLSPSLQERIGVDPKIIQCNENLVLVTKQGKESSACVTPVTKQHLMDRGWAKIQNPDEIKLNPESIKQNIVRIEDGLIALYPENMCASIGLDLLTEHDIQRYQNDKKGLNETNTLQITSSDLKEIPNIQELIYAVHSIEFPYNKYSSAYLDGIDFVEYEFFLMEKAIKKYGDSQGDYFIKLDNDYEDRFANPAKQGFTNHFEAPIIIYNDDAYLIGGTFFWTSDEHEPRRMGVYPRETVEEDKKFITLTDEDMESIPKIKEAIENIGTVQKSISAYKGMPEDRWNEYRDWFEQKSQDRLNADRFRLIEYNERLYSVGFLIC